MAIPRPDIAFAAAVLLSAGACSQGPAPTRHHAAPGALGPYSGSVEAGDLVFLSGKIGDRGGTFEHEVETALDAVEAELGGLGLASADLVSVTVYLTDMQLYTAFNEVYARRIPAPHPARACVAVAALPGGARVEVQAVARSR